MSELRTIFVGLRPRMSPELSQTLEQARDELRQGCRAKLVRPENYHLTLAFMGLPDREDAETRFAECAATLGDIGPFEVSFEAVAAFGNRRHPARVVFAEPHHHPSLEALGEAFRSLADRDPVFHLTLARTRSARDGRWVEANMVGPRQLGRAAIEVVALMANNGTAAYIDLLSHPLAKHAP